VVRNVDGTVFAAFFVVVLSPDDLFAVGVTVEVTKDVPDVVGDAVIVVQLWELVLDQLLFDEADPA
jgi:hypothetical protein